MNEEIIKEPTRDKKGKFTVKTRKTPVIILAIIILGFVVQGILATANQIATEWEKRIIAPLTYNKGSFTK